MMFRIYVVYLYILEELVMQVAKWGNSLAIRLPRSVVEVLGLKEGDSIEIHVADRKVFAIEKTRTSKQLLERLRKYRGRLPATFKFDRLEANERG
jgi:antitoxin MazE